MLFLLYNSPRNNPLNSAYWVESYLPALVKVKWSPSCNTADFQTEFWLFTLELQSVNHATYQAALGSILVQGGNHGLLPKGLASLSFLGAFIFTVIWALN